MSEDLMHGTGEGAFIESGSDTVSAEERSAIESAEKAGAQEAREAAEESRGGSSASEGKPNADGTEIDPAAPTYTPNFKYRVLQQEKEIPEKFRSLIKNEADEKELRELFEAADGLKEHFKPKFEQNERTLQQVGTEYGQVLRQIQDLRETFQRGDIDDFLKKLVIPEQTMINWFWRKYQLSQMDPAQREQILQNEQAQRDARMATVQRDNTLQQFQARERQARLSHLESELARPDVKPIVDAFDQKHGAGRFKQEVINRGSFAWQQSRGTVDLSPGQAVQEVVKLYGLQASPPASGGVVVTPQASGGNRTDTLPRVGPGKSSASPIKKSNFKSVDDIMKYRKENHGF